jgi:hypothetical protein
VYGVTPEYSVLQTCSTATSSADVEILLIVQILKYELSMEIMPAVSLLPGLANLFIF